jgi:ketose-bisphosphate aldolase
MPLEPIGSMTRRASHGGYAVGYFESWNIESLQGVLDAAEQTRSPVLVGFNGAFLSSPRPCAERLALYAALGRAAAESCSVPCGLVFNECARDDWVESAIELGFNLVMLADAAAPPDDLTRRVATLTRLAHARGVAVEAEVGELPYGPALGQESPHGWSLTNPASAEAFVGATGVDLLAVSVGNVHIQLGSQRGLDLGLLDQIRRRVSVPLVLHGGTGIAEPALREAIKLGVVKVNYGTYLKQRYLKAIGKALGQEIADPHRLLGMGGHDDLLEAGRAAVREAVLERISVLGCCGQAGEGGRG